MKGGLRLRSPLPVSKWKAWPRVPVSHSRETCHGEEETHGKSGKDFFMTRVALHLQMRKLKPNEDIRLLVSPWVIGCVGLLWVRVKVLPLCY